MDVEFLKEEIKGLKLELALIREEEKRIREKIEWIEEKIYPELKKQEKEEIDPDNEIKLMSLMTI